MREEFGSLGVQPTVSSVNASEINLAGDYRAWDVSWVTVPGDVMEGNNFSCTGFNTTADVTDGDTCMTVLVASSAEATPISGTFTLTVFPSYADHIFEDGVLGKSETTTPLSYKATSADVQAALEGLGVVAAAEVELVNSLPNSRGGGSTFFVTFTGATGESSPMGGPSLSVSAMELKGTGVDAVVREVYPGSRWGGEFALSIGVLDESPTLPFDASAEEVRKAVEALVLSAGGKEGSVTVKREKVKAGFRWAVTFSDGDPNGNNDLLEVCRGCGHRGCFAKY